MLILDMSALRAVVFAFAAVFVMAVLGVAFADIYRYVDESGVVYYTDTPTGAKGEVVRPHAEDVPVEDTSDYFSIIKSTAGKYSMDPSLIHAVIKTESNFNQYAVSRKGAMGLMQLMPGTAQDLGVKNPFQPSENIDGGTRYLRYLLETFNWNLTLALAAYNCGPEPVKRHGNVPPIKETRDYVRKVLALYGVNPDTGGALPVSTKSQAKPSQGKSAQKKAVPSNIYRLVLDDGTVLFTNTKPSSNRRPVSDSY